MAPVLLDPALEDDLTRCWAMAGEPDPAAAAVLRERIEHYLASAPKEPVLLCGGVLRPALAEFLSRCSLPIEVLGFAELPPDMQLQPALVVKKPAPLPV